jgi:LacI family transcriptional regulator
MDVPSDWIMKYPLDQQGGESALQAGMKMTRKAEAYFCAGDFAAMGVLQAARRKGLIIPRDLGISGFANEPFTAFLEPSLTTVDQRGEKMGQGVAQMFLHCEEDKSSSEVCEQIILEPKLIIRNSSLLNG